MNNNPSKPHDSILDVVTSRRGFIGGAVALASLTLLGGNAIGESNSKSEISLNFYDILISDTKKSLLKGLSFGVASDLHIAPWNMDIVQEFTNKVDSLGLDFCVISGDLVDEYKKGDLDILDNLNTLTFIAPGNHDYDKYGKLDPRLSDYFKKRKNLEFLRNKNYELDIHGSKLNITGVGSLLKKDFGGADFAKKTNNYNILITHEPAGFAQSIDADFSIAGHTHGASKIVLSAFRYTGSEFLTDYDIKFNKGLFNQDNKILLTSNGIGKCEKEADLHYRASTPAIDVIRFI